MTCTCGDEAIQQIIIKGCKLVFGQTQKLAFQKVFSTGTTKNEFNTTDNDPKTLASWTAALAATDGTKVTITPFVSNPTNEPGDKREFGGGNATVGGIPIPLGSNPSTFSASIYDAKQETIKSIKGLGCHNVGVYLLDEHGQIGCIVSTRDTDGNPTKVHPIPIISLFIGDLKLGGFEEVNMNNLSFGLLPNWSDNFDVIKPTFNPLTDLAHA